MSTKSPRLYDLKRGIRSYLYKDAAMAVNICYTGGVQFQNSTKNKWWQNAKVAFEAMVGYEIDNARFYNLVNAAKKKNLLTKVW